MKVLTILLNILLIIKSGVMAFDKGFVGNIKKKIENHRDLYEKNEAAVRQHIIDPTLRELGWDIEDPDQVLPEDNTGEGGFPDYALLQDGRKIILIEAKKLSEEPMSHIKQLARYSSDIGSRYGLMTNGADFVMFKSYEEFKQYKDRVIWKINIENDSIERVLRILSSLSPNNILRIEELAMKSDNLNTLWAELIEDPETFAGLFTDYFEKQLRMRYNELTYEVDEVHEFLKEKAGALLSEESMESYPAGRETANGNQGGQYYTKMRLPGKEYRINAQNEILINVANWLIEKGKLSRNTVPIDAGHKRYLVNKENKNKDGRPLPGGKPINGGLWLMLNLSASNIVLKAYELLEKFGYQKGTLELE